MSLGKRPHPPMTRTTSMSKITFDLNATPNVLPNDPKNPPNPNPNRKRSFDMPHKQPNGSNRRHSSKSMETANFLRACSRCKRSFVPNRDIYMYRFSLRSASKHFLSSLSSSSSSSSSALPRRCFHGSVTPHVVPRSSCIISGLLIGVEDQHGGIIVNMEKKPMDSKVFSSLLHNSISHWRQQGKKGVWIKLPIESSNLVEAATKAGFKYHHAEPDYLMLVRWIPSTPETPS